MNNRLFVYIIISLLACSKGSKPNLSRNISRNNKEVTEEQRNKTKKLLKKVEIIKTNLDINQGKELKDKIVKNLKNLALNEDLINNTTNMSYDKIGFEALEKVNSFLEKIIDEEENKTKSFKFLTWNIWFSTKHRKERAKYIIEEIKKQNIDFVCLQEVEKESLEIINENRGQYKIFKGKFNNIEDKASYDTIILSKHDCLVEQRIPFKDGGYSNQGRNILKVVFEIKLNNTKTIKISIYNFHLESLKGNEQIRKEQLNQIYDQITQDDYFIIMGDTNFLNSDIEPSLLNFIDDAFFAANFPEDKKWTYDGNKNPNVSINPNTKKPWPPARLDRIFFNNGKSYLKSFNLIGLGPSVDLKSGKTILASDHFGVIAELIL